MGAVIKHKELCTSVSTRSIAKDKIANLFNRFSVVRVLKELAQDAVRERIVVEDIAYYASHTDFLCKDGRRHLGRGWQMKPRLLSLGCLYTLG